MPVRIIVGDALTRLGELPDQSVHCAITSPPYWGLRSYKGDEGMIGLEPTWDEHLDNLLAVFREVRRVLRDDGVCVVNYGDAYSGGGRGPGSGKQTTNAGSNLPRFEAPHLSPKNLMMMPPRLAIAMQEDGWFLRSMIPWIKKNPMPESVTDRPTSAVEYFFLFSKQSRYFWDAVAVRTEMAEGARKRFGPSGDPNFRNGRYEGGERPDTVFSGRTTDKQEEQQAGGANMRNYIFEATRPYSGAHFATFPPAVIEPFILAGTSEKGVCSECGAPWVRETKKMYENPGNRTTNGGRSLAQRHETAGFSVRLEKHVSTTGWRPTCECNAKSVPAMVLDPFGGAGTVGLVADRHQRDAILIEISSEYAEMARQRIDDDAGGLFGATDLEGK